METTLGAAGHVDAVLAIAGGLRWKLMSCSHVKSWVNFLTWLLIGFSLLCSLSGASLLVDTTLDNDYNS